MNLMPSTCISCGCNDNHACVVDGQACHWLEIDNVMGLGVCSNCPDALPELHARQKELVEFAHEPDL